MISPFRGEGIERGLEFTERTRSVRGMGLEGFRFFDPRAEIAPRENRLPHWQQAEAFYFVTFRLADSLPEALLRDWHLERHLWLQLHPKPWSAEVDVEYHRRFTAAIEDWLDRGSGECVLRASQSAEIVAGALRHFEGERCAQLAWVVMPNHVHVLFALLAGADVARLVQSWKRYSAVRINRGRSTPGAAVWEKDYFDRIVRDGEHLGRCVRYIRRNPGKARLPVGSYLFWESEQVRRF